MVYFAKGDKLENTAKSFGVQIVGRYNQSKDMELRANESAREGACAILCVRWLGCQSFASLGVDFWSTTFKLKEGQSEPSLVDPTFIATMMGAYLAAADKDEFVNTMCRNLGFAMKPGATTTGETLSTFKDGSTCDDVLYAMFANEHCFVSLRDVDRPLLQSDKSHAIASFQEGSKRRVFDANFGEFVLNDAYNTMFASEWWKEKKYNTAYKSYRIKAYHGKYSGGVKAL